ncbi:MAG: DUF721 domain-containing protein [Parachlamydia sp.]|nr:DUF721 domain-containing protein [Parachlamydia sp.]
MKRTPKNYDGTSPPAKTIGELLPGILSQIQKRSDKPMQDLIKEWPMMIGPKMAKMTEAVSFIDGVLTVVVKSSTLYSLLCQHEKPILLRKLQELFPKTQVRNIVFRIG